MRDGEGRRGESVSIWLRDEVVPTRASPLTRERIVAEAVRRLDRDGVGGLTMRRLAEHLDVTAAALYWHVRTKEDVLDLALDHIFGEVPLAGAGEDWRGDVRRLIRGWRAAMLRHPWAPGLIGRPMLGPCVLARTEFLQAALVRGGFADTALTVATRLLANFVIGSALTESTRRLSGEHADVRRHISGNPGAYPTLDASGHLDGERWNDDELFDLGLDAILAAVAPVRVRP